MDKKRKEEEVLELTADEIDELVFEEQLASGEYDEEVPEYYFSNPDPYAKVEPRPDDAPKREFTFDEKGNIVVKNLSAFWLPDVKIVDEIGGTEYTVTGSYEGTETLDRVEMEQKLRLQSEETIKVYKKRLAQAEKRIGELDRLFIKIYEDNAKGNLSDERFAMMSKTYEDEQAQLKVEIVNLQKEVEVQERQIENLEQFIQRVRRYTTLTELTPYALRELVKVVYVEAPDKSSGKRKQKVHIEYDLVGYIPVDELIKAEQA